MMAMLTPMTAMMVVMTMARATRMMIMNVDSSPVQAAGRISPIAAQPGLTESFVCALTCLQTATVGECKSCPDKVKTVKIEWKC